MGVYYDYDFSPFPFTMLQYQFAALWYSLTTVPFLIAQTVLCLPVLHAIFIQRCMHFVNHEIKQVIKSSQADVAGLMRIQLGERIVQLRSLHYEICRTSRKVDQALSTLLLASYVFDVLALFGFLGLLVNSKDARPSPTRLEWTFYLSSSVLWFAFFLFHFSVPVIRMAEEGDKTSHLVHAVTVTSSQILKDQYSDLSIFLSESRHNSCVFTGHRFYYINRHYIVATIALIASYLTVLTEILDRYYGTESLKSSLAVLATTVTNATLMLDLTISNSTESNWNASDYTVNEEIA
ncbi:uncharacterized protein LOC129583982 [Paramacrobiotus metropolitanus]|uniref:uncharacterized protein LOC129583982 n=1 Tax=Paramacrobiotus metropolitanus TaxID=2943436 RepID=UPI0024462AFF|nr:uncharacterized protein LOC129583982 [Paramacrobiotus metropolitanus]